MKLLSEEKLKVLAQRHGWSIARAQGFVEGETCRQRAGVVSIYRLVGMDDFAMGFRDGYFLRESAASMPSANLLSRLNQDEADRRGLGNSYSFSSRTRAVDS